MDDENRPVSVETRLKSWHDALDFLKSAILASLLLAFLIYPDAIWFILHRAGLNLKELSIFGATLEKTAAASNVDLTAALKDANQINDKLGMALAAANDSLAEANNCFSNLENLTACAKNKELVVQFEQRQKELGQSQSLVKNSSRAIESTLQANAKVLEQSQVRIGIEGTSWGVVFGGDTSRPAAEDEIRKAQKLHVPKLAVYLRQGSYRSVAIYDSRDAAATALATLKQINASAYVVGLERWCLNSQEKDTSNGYTFFECTSP